jgi:hypothetical protein
MSTLYTVTVDTEEEWDWASGFPIDEFSVANIRRCLPRFQALCESSGAKVTYFTNHAVFQNDDARTQLLDLAAREGVEIGFHIHPWNTPPIQKNGAVKTRESFLHNLPEPLIFEKLQSVYDRFTENGLKPTSYRGGRYSSGPVIHRFLRKNGFVADASVVPFTTWPDAGAPDYRTRNLLPKRLPPPQDGEVALWEIPLTLAFTRKPFAFWRGAFEKVERSPLRHLRLIGLAERVGLVRRFWLNFEDPLGENMLSLLDWLRRLELPCICFTLHSSSLMAGGNGYTPDAAAEQRIFRLVESVLQALAGDDAFQPATVSEVAAHLEEEYHARTRHQPA